MLITLSMSAFAASSLILPSATDSLSPVIALTAEEVPFGSAISASAVSVALRFEATTSAAPSFS